MPTAKSRLSQGSADCLSASSTYWNMGSLDIFTSMVPRLYCLSRSTKLCSPGSTGMSAGCLCPPVVYMVSLLTCSSPGGGATRKLHGTLDNRETGHVHFAMLYYRNYPEMA